MQQYLQFIPWFIAFSSLIVAYKSYSHNVSTNLISNLVMMHRKSHFH